jgi:hypothetical protein
VHPAIASRAGVLMRVGHHQQGDPIRAIDRMGGAELRESSSARSRSTAIQQPNWEDGEIVDPIRRDPQVSARFGSLMPSIARTVRPSRAISPPASPRSRSSLIRPFRDRKLHLSQSLR